MVAHKSSAQQFIWKSPAQLYSGQVMLPEESEQLRLHCHSATAPGATLLTMTSSSTLDKSRYLRSKNSSGYIATRLHCHSATSLLGHSSRSHVARHDEFVYSGQGTLPEESEQLRLHSHSATSPLGHSARSHVAHHDEFVYSGQVTLPEESEQLRLHCH